MRMVVAMGRMRRLRLVGDDLAAEVVRMVMPVGIDRDATAGGRAEEGEILRMRAHRLGPPGAADVMVEADDAVSRRHDQMQVV